jgi:hypothetical protein
MKDSNPSLPDESYSLRNNLLQAIQEDGFTQDFLNDRSILLCCLLKFIRNAWLRVCSQLSTAQLDVPAFSYLDDNWRLQDILSESNAVKRMIDMINKVIIITKARGCGKLQSRPGTGAYDIMEELRTDYQEVREHAEAVHQGALRYMSQLAALRSITESEKAIKQSERVG